MRELACIINHFVEAGLPRIFAPNSDRPGNFSECLGKKWNAWDNFQNAFEKFSESM